MKKLFWLIAFSCFGFVAQAQVSAGGTPVSFTKTFLGESVPVAVMPAVDVATLMMEDETRNVKGNSFRFGKDMDVNLNLGNSGLWQSLKNGDRVWRLGIKSVNAYSINLIFSQFYLPAGAKMFVYNADKSMVIGAFTSFNNKDHGKFSTDVVQGDHIIIEYFEPANVAGMGRIEVSKVIHAYYNIFFGNDGSGGRSFGQSGACNNNVVCPLSAGWENQINATLMYLLANGTEVCSGSILNNVREDGTPYFLSANHCYSNDYATWVFRFNYQSANCSPSQNGPTTQSVSGASLKARRSDPDFMLFELSVTPPLSYNVYYAGWNNVDAPASSAVGIHHPAGDVKKFSVENDPLSSGSFGGSSANSHWEVGDWDSGTTEGGSSGSPLFDQNKRVIGQLHGGGAACGNNQSDYYGKLSVSWNGSSATNRLKDWLDPDNTGAAVLDGTTFNVPTTQLDAQLSDITGIESYSCNTNITPVLRLQNRGALTLTSVSYRYTVQNGIWDTAVWTGSLAFGVSANITLPTAVLAPGSFTYQAQVLQVNGQADQNATNNTASYAFTIISGREITIALNTDFYADETTLRILDAANNIVWEETGFSDGTSYTLNPCLEIGCYKFVILDSYGDGICCGFSGNGSYSVTDPDGVLIVQGGDFGNSETTQFCVSNGLPPVVGFSASTQTVCQGASVTFTNQTTGTFTALNWSFPGGSPATSTSANPTVTYSSVGAYDVKLVATGPVGTDSVLLNSYIEVRTGPNLLVNTTNESATGATDGSAEALAGGFGPFSYSWNTGARTSSISGLAAGTYIVTVTDGAGCTSTRFATVGTGPVGIDNLESLLGVNVYPNPSNTLVAVMVNSIVDGTLTIYDNLGRRVFSQNQIYPINNIDVQAWPEGVYYVRITVAEGSVVKRLLVGM